MSAPAQARLVALRASIAALEPGAQAPARTLPFGDPRLDGRLPGGGPALGRWHGFTGDGLELETGAAAAGFVARLAAPLARHGEILWVMRRDDLHAPGLATLGFPAERLIQVCARDDDDALA